MWNFCHEEPLDEGSGATSLPEQGSDISPDELIECGAKAAKLTYQQSDLRSFYNYFGHLFWGIIDQNGSGTLDFDEFR